MPRNKPDPLDGTTKTNTALENGAIPPFGADEEDPPFFRSIRKTLEP
jgi:hypothetical protein